MTRVGNFPLFFVCLTITDSTTEHIYIRCCLDLEIRGNLLQEDKYTQETDI